VAKDRRADRHTSNQTGVYTRLDNPDLHRLDETRERLGIKSRRKAIITALREWLDRNENSEDPE
jgi:metal-responsive CopG/Arc/MetJ family transcriptional regulator